MMKHARIPAAVTLLAGLVSTTLVLTLAHASVRRDPPAPPAGTLLSPFHTPQVANTQVGLARGQGTQYFRTTTLHGGDKLVIYGMWTVFNAAPAPAPQPVVTLQLFRGTQTTAPLRMRVCPRRRDQEQPPTQVPTQVDAAAWTAPARPAMMALIAVRHGLAEVGPRTASEDTSRVHE